MDINIASVKNYEGKTLTIDCEISLPGRKGDDFRLVSPVRVCGELRKFGGTLELSAKAEAGLEFVCDRCAETYSKLHKFDISESFKEYEGADSGENPDINYFSGDELVLDDYVYSGLVLSLPGKHLCSEDCKGLCPVCGANLNRETCSCSRTSTDPRFDILDSLDLE